MKHVFLIILFFLFNINLYAFDFEGKVFDIKSKKPVKGATIGIKKINKITYSNDRGEFNFKNLTPDIYKVIIVHPDYGTKKLKIKFKRNFNVNIGLRKSIYKSKSIKKYFGEPIR